MRSATPWRAGSQGSKQLRHAQVCRALRDAPRALGSATAPLTHQLVSIGRGPRWRDRPSGACAAAALLVTPAAELTRDHNEIRTDVRGSAEILAVIRAGGTKP
jgi:hypothetical protein